MNNPDFSYSPTSPIGKKDESPKNPLTDSGYDYSRSVMPICESFSWYDDVKDMVMEQATPGAVRVKVVFCRAGQISKNRREYMEEELVKATRTMIGHSVDVNHEVSVWEEKTRQGLPAGPKPGKVGRIPWAEYDLTDHKGEAVIEITKEPYVTLLKNKSAKILGVSMSANFVKAECSKCGKKFANEKDLNKHLMEEEFIKDGLNRPRGIIFNDPAMSLVLSPSVPGCQQKLH